MNSSEKYYITEDQRSRLERAALNAEQISNDLSSLIVQLDVLQMEISHQNAEASEQRAPKTSVSSR